MWLRTFPFLSNSKLDIIFWIALACWVLPEIFAWKLKRSTDSAVILDRGSLHLVSVLWWIGILAGFLFSLLLPNAVIPLKQPALFFTGISCIVAGIVVRWYSVSILGEYFTFNVAIQNNQVLVERGPYRYVRHPSYSGALLSIVGFGLALGNWWSLGFSFSCLALAYVYRIPIEESALRAAFGARYLEYRKRTSRLVPFLF